MQLLQAFFAWVRKKGKEGDAAWQGLALAPLALGLVLFVGVARLPAQAATLAEQWPLLRRWGDPQAQYRLALENVPYDVLQAVDALLPPDAPLLLVTSGQDVRHAEYVTYHRALYFLTPRPVWWLSPAPADGTWESRWWISAPATAPSVRAQAADRGIACVLLVGVTVPAMPGRRLAQWNGTSLWQIEEEEAVCQTSSAAPAAARTLPPAWPLRLAAALLAIFALGYGVMGVARHFGYPVSGLAAAAPAWLLGAGLITTAMLWLDALGLRLPSQLVVLTTLALAATLLRLRKTREVRGLDSLQTSLPLLPPTTINFLMLAFLALQSGYVFLQATGRPLTVWDSWVNWALKARTIFREGAVTAAVYAEPSRAVTLLDYPLSVPLLEAWLYGWLGAPDDRLAGLLFPLFYLALVGIVYVTVKEWGGPPAYALLAAAAVAAIGHVVGLAAIAFPDLIVAVLATLAAASLLSWLQGGAPGSLLVGALSAGLLPWTKREGLVLLGALCLAVLLASGWRRRRTWLALGACALGAAVFAGPWWWFAAGNSEAVAVFLPPTPANFVHNLNRLPVIARMMALNMIGPRLNYVWPLAFLPALWKWRSDTALERPSVLFPLTALLYSGLMSLTYVFSDFAPYQQHVASSGWRLLAQVTPLLVLWMARSGLPRNCDGEGSGSDDG